MSDLRYLCVTDRTLKATVYCANCRTKITEDMSYLRSIGNRFLFCDRFCYEMRMIAEREEFKKGLMRGLKKDTPHVA